MSVISAVLLHPVRANREVGIPYTCAVYMEFNSVKNSSGGSRPSAEGGGAFEGLTMNDEFCEEKCGSAQKMCYFPKKIGGRGYVPPGPLPWICHCTHLRSYPYGIIIVIPLFS